MLTAFNWTICCCSKQVVCMHVSLVKFFPSSGISIDYTDIISSPIHSW